MSPKKGFTLIELMVVIAIIGLLASVVIASLNSARVKARDTRRISDLEQIRNALELYYNTNGNYPIISRWATSELTTYDSTGTRWVALQNALLPYMSKLPNDPKPTGTSGPWKAGNYHYAYGSDDGQVYDLVAQLEDTNNNNRCAIKQWKYHIGEIPSCPSESVWCSSSCYNSNFSPYMYADH